MTWHYTPAATCAALAAKLPRLSPEPAALAIAVVDPAAGLGPFRMALAAYLDERARSGASS